MIKVTNYKSYLSASSSGINWQAIFDLPEIEVEFSFKEITFCFPDFKQSVKAWLDIEVPSRIMNEFKCF